MGKVGIHAMATYPELLSCSLDHISMVFWTMLFAIPLGVAIGVILTRPGFSRISTPVMAVVSMGQAIPSLALIAIIAILPLSIGTFAFGFNFQTVIVALVVYGLMPIIRNSYIGIHSIDPAIIESAEGMGMTRWQIFHKIELPIALPVIVTGVRISIILVIGTAVLAVLVGGGGLGVPTFRGVFNNSPHLIIQGAAPTAAMAIIFGYLLETIENLITPRGLKLLAGKR